MKKYVNSNFPHLLYGADYNPEQWKDTPEIYSEDMRLMKKANCNVMSVNIFGWAQIEPREGEFDFSLLDETIDRIYRNGGRVLLATPSGARPHWMVDKYPEVMRVNENGERLHFRDRHNHCYTSPVYREKVRIINTKLAERYGHHPAVIAWHISNEYSGECYCPLCKKAFVEFLKKRYDNDISKLNSQYWSSFWSLKYDSFEQIEPPTPLTVGALCALKTDWQRFVTAQTADFIDAETAPLKMVNPDIPTTTNMMAGIHLNYFEIARHIDFSSWDSYPEWDNIEKRGQTVGFWHDFFRSLHEKPFLMMESALGLVNWRPINKIKKPGLDKLELLMATAHGSDSVQYFQFRKGRGGAEKFHGAIVDHEGSENTRLFKVVSDVGETLRKIDEVAGSVTKSRVAILMDWENKWMLDYAEGFNREDKQYVQTCEAYHAVFHKRGINVDIINSERDFSKYSLIAAPMLYSVSEKTIEKIENYVKNGGCFYTTYISGQVNENDLCYLGGFPANGLKDVFGLRSEEVNSLMPNEHVSVKMNGASYDGIDYCENVYLQGASVLAECENDFGLFPALTENSYGSGLAYYQVFRDTGDFKDDAIGTILDKLGIKGGVEALPEGVSCHTRENDDAVYLFVENYTEEGKQVTLDGKYTDLINGSEKTEITLAPLEVCVLKRENVF